MSSYKQTLIKRCKKESYVWSKKKLQL